MIKKCKVKTCNNKYKGNGFCHKHNEFFKRNGYVLERTVRYNGNLFIEKNKYFEIVLCSNGSKEIARALIDKNDVDKCKKYKWYFNKTNVRTNLPNKKMLSLHHIVIGHPSKKLVVDHINRNILDNRKNNLRIVNKSQNAQNTDSKKNNSSGIKGISKQNNKWRSRITIGYKTYNLGIFLDKIDAIKARVKAEKKYYTHYAQDAIIHTLNL